jgi:hypothetical protein
MLEVGQPAIHAGQPAHCNRASRQMVADPARPIILAGTAAQAVVLSTGSHGQALRPEGSAGRLLGVSAPKRPIPHLGPEEAWAALQGTPRAIPSTGCALDGAPASDALATDCPNSRSRTQGCVDLACSRNVLDENGDQPATPVLRSPPERMDSTEVSSAQLRLGGGCRWLIRQATRRIAAELHRRRADRIASQDRARHTPAWPRTWQRRRAQARCARGGRLRRSR